ncbi:MAG: PAS domain S-box protein [Burkholderiaceae bacterium]
MTTTILIAGCALLSTLLAAIWIARTHWHLMLHGLAWVLARAVSMKTASRSDGVVTLRLSYADLSRVTSQLDSAYRVSRSQREALENLVQQRTNDLEHIKQRLELVIETISDGLIVIHADQTIASLNPAACKIFGCGANDATRMSVSRFLGYAFSGLPTTGAPIETKARRFDGTPIEIELSLREAVFSGERIRIATVRDISMIKRARSLLQQQAHIIKESQSFFYVTDREGRLEWCNPRFEELTGYAFEQVAGKRLSEFLPGKDTDAQALQHLVQAEQTMQSFRTEILLYHASGRPFWVDIDAQPLADADSESPRFVGLGSDITDRRFSAQMQVDFISMVSHELRTPLTVISGTLEALIADFAEDAPANRLPEKMARTLVDMGSRNCVKLAKLIDDLLDINKIEGGAMRLRCRKVNLAEVVNESLETVEALANEAGVYIRRTDEEAAGVVFADPARLNQVLLNLLSNAIKFSQAGSLVEIGVVARDERVRVSVSDQGRGIPDAFQPMIFQKFSRDVHVEASGTDGFGLGLCIAKGLVEQMGGTLDFHSIEGKGSCFFFDLPALDASPQPGPGAVARPVMAQSR